MPLVTMNEVLSESIQKKYAVGAFDTMDHLFTEAILMSAEEKNVPVILMVMELTFDSQGVDHFMEYLVDRCKNSSVPVALHLDHASCFESIMKAIHYGFTSVMLDGSSLPFDENVALTKKVVEVAHACNVSVEAEIGHVGGQYGPSDGHVADAGDFTTVDEAVLFYKETGIDCLAIAIGSVHGVYKGNPCLDLERLQAIRNALPIPLVMHGGSGMRPEDYKHVILHGMNKINFFTAMTLAGVEAVQKLISENRKLQMSDITNTASKAIAEIVGKHLEIFGTQSLFIK